MLRAVPTTVFACCCLMACQTSSEEPTQSNTTTFRLETDDNGNLERCDADGNCYSLDNPEGCDVLVITIDNLTGRTCERCETADGSVLSERCDETHVVCALVTVPEPDCVVCSYDQGPIIYSSCVPDTANGCQPEDCGRSVCPAYECPDGSWTGACECVHDAATDTCAWQPIVECAPTCDRDGDGQLDAGCCRWDSDCPAGQHCEGSSVCPPDVVCVWEGQPGICVPNDDTTCTPEECGPARECPIVQCADGSEGGCLDICERDAATGACGWVYRECPAEACTSDADCPYSFCWHGACQPEGACRWDSDCAPTARCDGSSVCPPDVVCVWEGEPGWCGPIDDTACTPEECGPARECPLVQCADGSEGGCLDICERDAATGVCGWVYRECPSAGSPCGDFACPRGYECCNPLAGICVPEGSDMACIQ